MGEGTIEGTDGAWIILRCAGRDTLRLAESLGEDGFGVWTPIETKVLEAKRARPKRTAKLPILPSYVFAHSDQLDELLRMARLDVRPRRGAGWGKPAHAGFSVMHYGDSIPLISDRHLQALRQHEEDRSPRKRKERPDPLPAGMSVQIAPGHHGSFSGVSLGVERSDGRSTSLRFVGNGMRVTIPTSILVADDVSASPAKRVSRHRNETKYLGREPTVGKALSSECESVAK